MPESVAKQIISEIVDRLSGISIGAGYYTDAGGQVLTARRTFQTLDHTTTFPVLSVFMPFRDYNPTGGHERQDVDGAVWVEGHCLIDDDATAVNDLENLAADIEKAVMGDRTTPARNLNNLVGDLQLQRIEIDPPVDGSEIGSVTVAFRVFYPMLVGDPFTVL